MSDPVPAPLRFRCPQCDLEHETSTSLPPGASIDARLSCRCGWQAFVRLYAPEAPDERDAQLAAATARAQRAERARDLAREQLAAERADRLRNSVTARQDARWATRTLLASAMRSSRRLDPHAPTLRDLAYEVVRLRRRVELVRAEARRWKRAEGVACAAIVSVCERAQRAERVARWWKAAARRLRNDRRAAVAWLETAERERDAARAENARLREALETVVALLAEGDAREAQLQGAAALAATGATDTGDER